MTKEKRNRFSNAYPLINPFSGDMNFDFDFSFGFKEEITQNSIVLKWLNSHLILWSWCGQHPLLGFCRSHCRFCFTFVDFERVCVCTCAFLSLFFPWSVTVGLMLIKKSIGPHNLPHHQQSWITFASIRAILIASTIAIIVQAADFIYCCNGSALFGREMGERCWHRRDIPDFTI